MKTLHPLKEALELLGASQNAISFYLTSFRAGKSSIGNIASKAGLDRSSAYLASQQLLELGLLDHDLASRGRLVWAQPPAVVMQRLRLKIRQYRNQQEILEQALPALLQEYNDQTAKPVVRVFTGHDGLRQVEEDVLSCANKEILLFSNQAQEKKVFNELDHKDFIKRRIDRGVHIKVLAADTPESHMLKQKDKHVLRTTRIIQGPPPFSNEIYIYDDKIAMLDFDRDVIGFIVTSKSYGDFMRWVFVQLWDKHGEHVHEK